MKSFIIQSLQNELKIYVKLVNRKLTNMETKEINEFAFLLLDITELGVLNGQEKALISRLVRMIASKLYVSEKIFYFHSFYKMPQLFFKTDSEKVGKATFNANVDINIMRLQIRCDMVYGSSEDEYFFSRGESGLLRAVTNLLNHNDDISILVPSFYTLLNYFQSVMEYLNSGSKLYAAQAIDLSEKCERIITKFLEKKCILEKLDTDFQLRLFLIDILKRYQNYHQKKLDYFRQEYSDFWADKNIVKKIWGYHSISNIDVDKHKVNFISDFNALFSDKYDNLKNIERIILLRNCIKYQAFIGELDLTAINVPLFEEYEKNDWFNLSDYFNGYNDLSRIEINEGHRVKVNSLSDNELRNLIAKSIINVDSEIVERERKKPHGVSEISDMELPVTKKRVGNTCYMCLPFKSGREVKDKINESVTYQVFRPFTNFGDKAIVVFVSPREGTEPFYNAIKRAKANLNWSIHTLMGDTLVKLLKFNNLI